MYTPGTYVAVRGRLNCSLADRGRNCSWVAEFVFLKCRHTYSLAVSVMSHRPHLSAYARQRAKQLFAEGASDTEVVGQLEREGIHTCRQTVWRLRRHIAEYGTVQPLAKPGRSKKVTQRVLEVDEQQMQEDDETTGKELSSSVLRKTGIHITPCTARRARRSLGWTRRGAAYCQLIREGNRAKRLEWAKENLGASFHDVIWTDETTVQLETHRRYCCRKRGQPPRRKPRPKHPCKVHVWAGISWKGATRVCIFDGIMNAELYTEILDRFLVPFIQTVHPHGHRFQQDPKHTSLPAQIFC